VVYQGRGRSSERRRSRIAARAAETRGRDWTAKLSADSIPKTARPHCTVRFAAVSWSYHTRDGPARAHRSGTPGSCAFNTSSACPGTRNTETDCASRAAGSPSGTRAASGTGTADLELSGIT